MGCSALLALTLSCLLLFQVCSAQFPWQSQQPQQQQCRQSQCRLDNLNALNPDRKVESEAGLSEYWDENNDQFQCAGVCHTIQRNGLLLPVFTNTPQLVYVVKDGMADLVSYGDHERDVEQALVALKKGTQLLKYSRKGKPKFRPFRLSADGTTLIWCSHGEERNLKLSTVSRIIPGQRTPVFRRFLRPEKDYLSFSLIYKKGERSLDLVCKDRAEVEVWLAGLGALVSTCQQHSRHNKSDIFDLREGCDSISNGRSLSIASLEFPSSIAPGSFSTNSSCREYSLGFKDSDAGSGRANMHRPGDGMRISVSSSPSCSSGGSGPDDIESLGDVYVWGEVWLDSTLPDRSVRTIPTKVDVLSPKSLESNVVLDVHQIACGVRHVALVTRQGEVFTWGEESGGRLGHGIDKDFSTPHLVEFLAMNNVDFVACGEYHSCAVSTSGDLFTWGDGIHNAGLLGHGTDISHWIPKRITGPLEGLQVLSVACGTWHSALATSNGKVFTFGDGTFGVLGHGDQQSVSYPRQVQSLSGLRTIKVACGVWHTAAIVEVMGQPGGSSPSKKLFTWGDGDNYRLGHGNKDTYLLPTCVSTLIDYNFHQLACGHTMTVALTTSGHVFTMGGTSYGQLGNPTAKGKTPCLVQDKLVGEFVEEISCGAFHVAVMTSRSEIFTWGRGANGRLGHGDPEDRKTPTLVEALKDMHVKNISCGSNFTASICIHKWVSGADQSVCSGCRQAFGFTRKRHNCYNCGLVHCHSCSSKKAIKAALAPTPGKPHRVCDACYTKLKAAEAGYVCKISKKVTSNHRDYVNRGEIKSSRILLPPTIEPIKYLESRSAKPGSKYDYSSIVRASQVPSLLRLNDIAFPSSISAIQNALKPITPTSPQLVISSRSTPPYTRRPNSPLSTAPVFSRSVINNLKKTNDVLTKEVSKLQSQVKSLKHKNDVQDREIQRLHEDTGEAAYLVGKHSSKWREAKELIKSFTEQLKEMTEKLPQEISESETLKSLQARAEDLLNPTNEPSEISLSLLTNLAHNQQSGLPDGGMKENGHAPRVNRPSNYSTRDNEPQPSSENDSTIPESLTLRIGGGREVIEQFEPGVYITLLQLQNGTRIYRRVKFSKRKFSEQQAAEWWNNNKDRVYGRYCRTKATPVPAESPSTPAPFEENNEATPSSQA